VLDAGGDVPWRCLREGLRELAWEDPTGSRELRLRVYRWPCGRPHYLGTTLHGGPASSVRRGAPTIRLATVSAAGHVVLTLADRSWPFPAPGTPHEPEFVTQVNEVWREVEAALERAGAGTGPAHLILDAHHDGLWYAHIVTVLDLLIGIGVEEVDFVNEGFHLGLHPPSGVGPPRRPPSISWGMVGMSVIAVLLAFLLTYLPLRSRKR
jgi:hypothetical protein